jgi:hypothetical protein
MFGIFASWSLQAYGYTLAAFTPHYCSVCIGGASGFWTQEECRSTPTSPSGGWPGCGRSTDRPPHCTIRPSSSRSRQHRRDRELSTQPGHILQLSCLSWRRWRRFPTLPHSGLGSAHIGRLYRHSLSHCTAAAGDRSCSSMPIYGVEFCGRTKWLFDASMFGAAAMLRERRGHGGRLGQRVDRGVRHRRVGCITSTTLCTNQGNTLR